MVEVTDDDRAAMALIRDLFEAAPAEQTIVETVAQAFATHRIEAAKAERDRLRKLPDDVLLRAMDSFNNGLINKPDASNPRGFVTYYDPLQASKNLVAALADALESQP